MLKELIKLQGPNGETPTLAEVAGGIAVHRRPGEWGWQVTHVRTGMGLANVAIDYQTARRYAKDLRAMKCWDWGSLGSQEGMPAGLFERTRPIYQKHCGQ